jgi:hypothetical protein
MMDTNMDKIEINDIDSRLDTPLDRAFRQVACATSVTAKLLPRVGEERWEACGQTELPGHLPHIWLPPESLKDAVAKKHSTARSRTLLAELRLCPGYAPCEPHLRKSPAVSRRWCDTVPTTQHELLGLLIDANATTCEMDHLYSQLRGGIIFPARKSEIVSATPALPERPAIDEKEFLPDNATLLDRLILAVEKRAPDQTKKLPGIVEVVEPEGVRLVRALEEVFSINPTLNGVAGAFRPVYIVDVAEVRLDRGEPVKPRSGIEFDMPRLEKLSHATNPGSRPKKTEP